MKTLIILLLSLSAYSKCEPYIPLSRAQAIAAITAYEQLADIPMKLCKDAPDEECLCSEGDVSASKIVDVFENGAPIYGPKTNVKKCMSEQDCAGFIGICGPGEGEFFYALLPEPELVEGSDPAAYYTHEAYCTQITGYEQVKVGHKLVPDLEKKAVFDAAKQAKEEAADLAAAQKLADCQDIQGMETAIDALGAQEDPIPGTVNTIAQLRTEMNIKIARMNSRAQLLQNLQKKVKGCLR
jgi:hypothetical protein